MEKAKAYNSIKIRLKLLDIGLLVLYLLLFQVFASAPLKTLVLSFPANFFCALCAYLIVFSIFHYAFNFPLHFYSSFLLEHKFSLSEQSFFNWFKDDLKAGLLSLFLFLIFISVLYASLINFRTTWWVWMAAFWFFATVVLAKVAPNLIIPLFFKYSPVDESLKERIMTLSEKCGIKILDVYKIDFSKKTKKMNAAVVGLGGSRRVIVADNLLENFNEREIEGVLAHEFGHHRMRHMLRLLSFGFVSIFFSMYILYLASGRIAVLMNAENIHDIRIFPAFMLVLVLAALVTMPLQNWFSRRLERDADLFALKAIGDNEVFISLMKKLAEKNLADPDPPKLVEIFFYDHPPISERIRLAERFKKA